MKKIYCIIILIYAVTAYSQNINFRYLMPEEGLSQITVNHLHVDEDGIIWMATRVGLNCYNGNAIQVYRHNPNNEHSLFCNNVLRLTGDGQGNLYLLCSEGVAQLDLQTRNFKTLKYGNIGAICFHDKLYISENNRVMFYSPTDQLFKSYIQLPNHEIITCMTIDSRRRLWLGTQNGGLYCYSNRQLSHPLQVGNITMVYEDSKNGIWIGSWAHGFWYIDNNGQIVNTRKGKYLISDFVRTFCEDNQGDMWIGTFHGLTRYNQEKKESTFFTAENIPGSLSNASIWSIVKDQQGTLWIGTYFGGVNYFNPEYEIYTHYHMTGNESSGLSSQIVGRMAEDDNHNLWICTEGGGLNIYNRKTHQFSWHSYPGKLISQKNLKAIYFDQKRNIMWIGTHLGGLDRIDLKTGKSIFYRHLKDNKNSLPSDIIRDIIPYENLLIIATQKGISLMNPEKETFSELLVQEQLQAIPSICIDRSHHLWIATEGKGIYCYDLKRKTYEHFVHSKSANSLSSNYINHIMQDRQGRIWLSTASNGINLYLEKSKEFVNYGEQEGLQGNCVYACTSSSLNNKDILLITNHGFSVFDTANKIFHNYDRTNGFPLVTINENALFVTHDGEIFIGGVQGMISFNEKDLYKKIKPYRLGFSRLYVNGKEITPGDENKILKKALRYTDEIILNHQQSIFSIEYYTSNYINANSAPLEYRLKGFSNHWLPISHGQNTQTFAGLHSGTYTLELRSGHPDSPIAKLKIQILPPWYLSWWAYLIYISLSILSVTWLIHNYRNRIHLSESLKYEQKHVRDIEEQNQSKIKFFTNVSHEIRTPLTVISGLAENLLQSKAFTPDVYNKLLGIYRNSVQLKSLISELLYFRKQEQGYIQLHIQKYDIVSLTKEIILLFKEYAISKDIHLQLKSETNLELWFDKNHIQKVISNMISNALKHTPQGGVVTITITTKDDYAYLSIADTGEGIDVKSLNHIFRRFYQGRGFESLSKIGTGIGLHLSKDIIERHHGNIQVESQLNEGTIFTISLPLNKNAFPTHEIDTEEVSSPLPPIITPLFSFVEEKPEEIGTDDETNKATILIVEDNDDIRQLLVSLFKPYYRTLTAVDGKEALETIKDEIPDIVLSDILMPHMSGIELCKNIKQDFTICHIPVVLLTARTATEQTIAGLKIGADDYITKPFNNDVLITRCNNLVNNRRILQRKFSEHPHTEADMLASNPLDKELLDRAMKIIDKYYTDTNFNIEIFAREIGMSRTALFTKWKTLTGQTPKSFILNLRLRKAAEMLRNNPELNIAEICYRNGFSSPRYFCKCFKDTYKQQPSTYRQG